MLLTRSKTSPQQTRQRPQNKMQSSPVASGRHSPPSPTHSDYSIDLAALDMASRSGATTPVPAPHVDRILSDDVEGPSDFTLNMEKWIRGGSPAKPKKEATNNDVRSAKHFCDAEIQCDRSLLALPKDRVSLEGSQGTNQPTSCSPAPKESMLDTAQASPSCVQDTSHWDQLSQSSTPQPSTRHMLLQPTVEDYYSELTPAPARPTEGTSPTDSKSSGTLLEAQKRHHHHGTAEDSPKRTPMPSRFALRGQSTEGSDTPTTSPRAENQLLGELEKLRARCTHLEQLNRSMDQALTEERRIREVDAAAKPQGPRCSKAHSNVTSSTASQDEVLPRHDLNSDGTTAAELQRMDELSLPDSHCLEKVREDMRKEFHEQLECERRRHGEEVRALRKKLDSTHSTHKEDPTVQEQLDRERAERALAIRSLEQDLELARRGRDSAEESARSLRMELERHGDDHDAELDRMQYELNQVSGDAVRIDELEQGLREAQVEIGRLARANEAAVIKTEKSRSQVDDLSKQKDDLTRLAAERDRAVELAEDMRNEVQALRQQLTEAPADREVSPSPAVVENEFEPVERLDKDWPEQENQQAKLNTAILERDEARDAVADLQAQLTATLQDLEAARQKLVVHEQVNEALDNKISSSIRKREEYWRGRLEQAEKERRVMAKTLLRQWGREEVGIEEPNQRYRYRYVHGRHRSTGQD